MKALIVFYSRTGNTRRVAQALAHAMGAEFVKINEPVSRSGLLGYIAAGRDAALKREVPISPLEADPAQFDLVIVGTPIWAWTMAAPVRTFLTKYADKLKSVAFFCTEGGSGHDRAFRHMEELTGKPPVAKLSLREKELKDGLPARIAEFVKTVSAAH